MLFVAFHVALLAGCGAPDDATVDEGAESAAQGLNLVTPGPRRVRFDKCCANCPSGNGVCNTCNSPDTNPISGAQYCPALQTPTNCDDNGENCRRASQE
jgi:hypothetical protein